MISRVKAVLGAVCVALAGRFHCGSVVVYGVHVPREIAYRAVSRTDCK